MVGGGTHVVLAVTKQSRWRCWGRLHLRRHAGGDCAQAPVNARHQHGVVGMRGQLGLAVAAAVAGTNPGSTPHAAVGPFAFPRRLSNLAARCQRSKCGSLRQASAVVWVQGARGLVGPSRAAAARPRLRRRVLVVVLARAGRIPHTA